MRFCKKIEASEVDSNGVKVCDSKFFIKLVRKSLKKDRVFKMDHRATKKLGKPNKNRPLAGRCKLWLGQLDSNQRHTD